MLIDTSLLSQLTSGNPASASARLNQSPASVNSNSPPATPADAVSVSAQLDAQVQATEAAGSSVSNAVSFTQTQDGYLQNIGAALDRMGELSQAAQDPSASANGSAQSGEFAALNSYILDASGKEFNGVSLFSGAPLQVTVDASGTTLSLPGINLASGAWSATAGASIGTTTDAAAAFTGVQNARAQLASDQATVRQNQGALNQAADQLDVTLANLNSANLPITDAGNADAATEAARQMILSDPNAALAAQGESLPQTALDLLQ